jgi:hypothetical protein
MKKLGTLALLLSLGLFTFGCTKTDSNMPAENGAATEDASPNGDAEPDAAPAADDATPPEQG